MAAATAAIAVLHQHSLAESRPSENSSGDGKNAQGSEVDHERRATMSAIRATWKNGQIVPDDPIDLPEGMRLLIEPDPLHAEPSETREPGWSNSPDAIADWLKWSNSLEPLIMTAAEEANTEAWLKKMDEYGIAKMDQRMKDLFQ
jgi:hypothetical protein